MLPLIGREWSAARKGYGGGGIGVAQDITGTFVDIENGNWLRALDKIGVAAGVPTVGPKRVIKAVKEGDITELVGGPPRD